MSTVAAKPKPMANQKASSASSEDQIPAPKAAASPASSSSPARDKAAEKMAEARKKNLDLAISAIQKEFGETKESNEKLQTQVLVRTVCLHLVTSS